MSTITLDVAPEIDARIDAVCAILGVDRGIFVNAAFASYLDAIERQARGEQFYVQERGPNAPLRTITFVATKRKE